MVTVKRKKRIILGRKKGERKYEASRTDLSSCKCKGSERKEVAETRGIQDKKRKKPLKTGGNRTLENIQGKRYKRYIYIKGKGKVDPGWEYVRSNVTLYIYIYPPVQLEKRTASWRHEVAFQSLYMHDAQKRKHARISWMRLSTLISLRLREIFRATFRALEICGLFAWFVSSTKEFQGIFEVRISGYGVKSQESMRLRIFV